MAKDFSFKQFNIKAFSCGMPVSTDAVLLGSWAKIDQTDSIIDIGTGTGVLAIMCAQRNLQAQITAVEIEENAFNAATQNCAQSPWHNRLDVRHSSIALFSEKASEMGQVFKSIICNPPYFNHGLSSTNPHRAIARHTSMLSHNELIGFCAQLLSAQGTASFVLPIKEGMAFIQLISQPENRYLNLTLSRLTHVKTTVNKVASRLLIELTKQTDAIVFNEEELVIHNGSSYTAEFIALTQQFYLKM
jgi:tRNA1Val (adenine37-N6)-methyltransferase